MAPGRGGSAASGGRRCPRHKRTLSSGPHCSAFGLRNSSQENRGGFSLSHSPKELSLRNAGPMGGIRMKCVKSWAVEGVEPCSSCPVTTYQKEECRALVTSVTAAVGLGGCFSRQHPTQAPSREAGLLELGEIIPDS